MEGTDTKKEEVPEQTVGPRIINVSANRAFSFFVFQAKKFLHVCTENPTVELHSIGGAISVAVQAGDALVKHGYCNYVTIKTDRVDVERDGGESIQKAKLFITLTKADTFDKSWEEFEKSREEREKGTCRERVSSFTLKPSTPGS